jgi:exopolysaccharide biosynthesis WecB/TagA/CpsF family protein
MNSTGTPWPRMFVGNVAVDLIDRQCALGLIMDSLSASDPLAVAWANVDHIRHFADDESWTCRPPAVSVNGPANGMRWLTLIDGVSLVRTANARGGRSWLKLSGRDLITPIMESAAAQGVRVGILGGAVGTHRQLRTLVGQQKLPDIRIGGTWAPTRSEVTDPAASERIAAEIRHADVDILFVGLDKPRQEQWIARFGPATGARVLLAFGAATDFLTSPVGRAPQRVTKAGAKWAWRLMVEPWRLSPPYLIECPLAWLRLKRTARVVEAAFAPVPRDGVERGSFVSRGEHAEVAALVVTYNSASDISRLIDDLRLAAHDRPTRLIVVDNQSSDDTANVVRAHDDIILVEPGGNLGYAGGINAGLPLVGNCDNVLILNPDLALVPDTVTRLLAAANAEQVGAVVPLILDEDGAISRSLCREPSLTRAVGDALLGSKIRARPSFSSEFDFRRKSYLEAHDVDWATGAALLVPSTVAREVGNWNEEFFLYSEEIDYFRRIRSSGRRIRFEPSAVVKHRGGGSGRSHALATLKAVNRVRYIERYHARAYSALFRGVVALAEALRSYDPVHRRTLAVILNHQRWQELPQATKPVPPHNLSGPRQRGAVIIPAYNEAMVIQRTLAPLSRVAVEGFIELIVVCNGCTDKTADVARSVSGVRVTELEQSSKPAALNAGDEAATLWPRLYLDADVQISAEAVLAVLDRLAEGDVLVASPESKYDWRSASALVRSYYRAWDRIRLHKLMTMWRAGAYGLNEKGHARFGAFPAIIGDDLYVDTRFDAHEKAVVPTAPSVRKTPDNAKSLLAILRRQHRGVAELLARERGSDTRVRDTSLDTAVAVVATIRGPQSAVDALVYLVISLAKRSPNRRSQAWERDESSRSTD